MSVRIVIGLRKCKYAVTFVVVKSFRLSLKYVLLVILPCDVVWLL